MNHEVICTPGSSAYEVMAAGYSNGADFWYEALPSTRNDSGVRVNAYTALGNCHVWKALNVLAGDIGQLPVKLFKKVGGRSVEVENIPEINCLRVEPNPWTLPSVWKETAMWTAGLMGNSYNWVYRPTPRVIQAIPLRADRVKVVIEQELTGEFYYQYTTDKGATIDFDREEVLHIPGLSTNGIVGLSLLDVARNVIGQGLAIEKHVNRSFSNGARPMGVLKHKGRLSKEARKMIRDEWNEMHEGADNAGKVAVIAEEMDYVTTSMTMEHAQVEALRRLDREFVASLFNLPLFKLNSLEHSATRSNLEQQNQEYLQGSLMRWLNRFAEEFGRKILSEQQRAEGYYYRWITEALLRGDTQSRFTSYGLAIQNRIMNPNEVREKEDMPPYEGGDEYGNPNIDKKQSPEDAKAANDAANEGGRPPGSMGGLDVVSSNVLQFDVKDQHEAAGKLIDDKMRQVVKTECNDIQRGALSENFVNWIEAYYGEGGGYWSLIDKGLSAFARDVEKIVPNYSVADVEWADSHAVESKRLLLKLCDQTTADRLAESVKEECATWSARATRA